MPIKAQYQRVAPLGRPGLRAVRLFGLATLCGLSGVLSTGPGGDMAWLSGAAMAEEASPHDDPVPPLSAQQVMALSDRGIELARAGDLNAGYALIYQANQATYGSDAYETLVKHYPNLALARYYMIDENHTEVESFASSVASALDTDEYRDHPYRIEAATLQGVALYQSDFFAQAELVLRGAVRSSAGRQDVHDSNQLGQYYLAMVATRLKSSDSVDQLNKFFQIYDQDGPISRPQAIHLVSVNLERAESLGKDFDWLLGESSQLLRLVEATEGIDPFYRAYYYSYHGYLLSKSQRYKEAVPVLQRSHEDWASQENYNYDYLVNVLRLSVAKAYAQSTQEGYDLLLPQIEIAHEHGASAETIAVLMLQLGHFAVAMDQTDLAQRHYRQGYAQARRSLRASHPTVKTLREQIDVENSGISGFAFAAELGAPDGDTFSLAPDGADVVQMFLQGNYVGLGSLLDHYGTRSDQDSQATAYYVNMALYQALMGAFDESQLYLTTARKTARSRINASVPPNAPIYDIVDTIARVWGSAHEPETANDALSRLHHRAENLSPPMRSVYLALAAFQKWQEGRLDLVPAMLNRWFDDYDPARPKTIWDIYGAAVVLEMAYTHGDPARAAQLQAETQADIDALGELPLAEDYLKLVTLVNAPNALLHEEALSELGILVSSVLDLVPTDHSIVASSEFTMANALLWRGRNQEALLWMRRATNSWRLNPYHRKDTLAFLLSRQADILLRMGKTTEASTIAREAYDMMDPYRDRPDLASGVIQTYALAIWNRTGDPKRAGDILVRHLDDPKFMGLQGPVDKVTLMKYYADALANYGALPDVLAVLDRAETTIPQDFNDWRTIRSGLFQSRAVAQYWNQAVPGAYGNIRRSNGLYWEWRADAISGGDGGDIEPQEGRNRAAWEALIGWDYAQSLPPENPTTKPPE